MKIVLIIFSLLIVLGGGFAGLVFAGIVHIPGVRTRAGKVAAKPKPAETPPRARDESPKPPVTLPAPSRIKTVAKPKQVSAPASPETDRNVARMASVYEQMPSEEAFPIFQELSDDLVVRLLRKMDEKQVSKLLSLFGPKRAAKLTAVLAH